MNKYQEALDFLEIINNELVFNQDYSEYSACFDCLGELQELIDKEDKYRWHDLRKDPNDLPKEDGLYVVYENVYSWGYCDYNTYECVKEVKEWSDGKLHKPIAWKYIEEFEDE